MSSAEDNPGTGSDGEAAQPARLSVPDPVPQDFVGSQVCRECHQEIADRYETHPMSRSLEAVLEAAPIEDYEQNEFSPLDSLVYRVERLDSKVVHHEVRTDGQGAVIYDQGIPVHFAIGSGARGRSYLINRSGRLYMSPITWYSSSARWGLSPGYAPSGDPRFDRRVSDGCMACHASRMAVDHTEPHRYQPRPFLETSIGCERCHGPARRHVEFHESNGTEGVDVIVNPSHLDNVARDAVCLQCHLQGKRRVLRYGRSEFDFRPGMTISDVWTTFPKSSDFSGARGAAAIEQVEQMHESTCFREGRTLTCISCHDPHGTPARDERVAFYRQRCLNCHSLNDRPTCSLDVARRQARSPEDSCIECHMPRFPAVDVAHTAQSDHRIPRWGDGSEALSRPEERTAEVFPTRFIESGVDVPDLELKRARGIFYSEIAQPKNSVSLATEAVSLLSEVLAAAPDDTDSRIAIGDAHYALRNDASAVEQWKHVLADHPSSEEALKRLSRFYHESNNPQVARGYYERLLEVNQDRADYYGRYAHVLGQLGEFRAGIVAAEKALELNPSLVQTHVWLAEVYSILNDEQRSRMHANMAQRFNGSEQETSAPVSPHGR